MKAIKILKTYYIKTYGCQMNYSDTERVVAVLHDMKLQEVKKRDDADMIVYVTCSVRQSAEDRIFGLKTEIQKVRMARNTMYNSKRLPITVITGCMCRRAWNRSIKDTLKTEKAYLKMLKRRLPWADIILEIKDIQKLPLLLEDQCSNETEEQSYLSISPIFKSTFQAYVPISTGCNEFCSYCIVPFARGKQEDLPADAIVKKVKELINKGYKDIMLLGQNVNSWMNPSVSKKDSKIKNFLDLLNAVDSIKGDFWLTFLSSHPYYFNERLINFVAKSMNKGIKLIATGRQLTTNCHIRPYLNIALQSGSNKILRAMNRKYTAQQYYKLCTTLKTLCPELNLSTDIIVGFPGETKGEYKKTKNLMKKIKFDMAYVNKYSPRMGTGAEKLNDTIPLDEKKTRDITLNKVLKKTALDRNKQYIGTKQRILVEKVEEGNAFGKTFSFKDVKFPVERGSTVKVGDFIDTEITNCSAWSLEGTTI